MKLGLPDKKVLKITRLLVVFSLGLLILSLGLYVYYYFNPPQRPLLPTKRDMGKRSQKQVSSTAVNLHLEPLEKTIYLEDQLRVDVLADSRETSLTGADLYVSWDQSSLKLDSIKPGPHLPKPQVLKEKLNEEIGEIVYSLGSVKPASGSGILATLEFEVIANKKGKSWVKLESKTQTACQGFDKTETFLGDPGNYQVLVKNE